MKMIKIKPNIPKEFQVENISDNEANLIVYPFEPGYAVSVAHPIRRFLLSSSVGYAPIGIKIKGVSHEFDNIRGMLEGIPEFMLNLKALRFRLDDAKDFEEITYTFTGPMEVKGSDFVANNGVEVITPDVFLATLNEEAILEFTLVVYRGIGYVSSEDIRSELSEDFIPLDAYFTPVKRAQYTIENTLVDDNPSYEKIIMNISTDGQITPIEAFKDALEVMYSQLAVFNSEVSISSPMVIEKVEESLELKQLMKRIDELSLSARSFNCLDRSSIRYIGQIVMMSENDLRNVKNLGKKSLDEIKHKLEGFGFPVGMALNDELLVAFKKKIEND